MSELVLRQRAYAVTWSGREAERDADVVERRLAVMAASACADARRHDFVWPTLRLERRVDPFRDVDIAVVRVLVRVTHAEALAVDLDIAARCGLGGVNTHWRPRRGGSRWPRRIKKALKAAAAKGWSRTAEWLA